MTVSLTTYNADITKCSTNTLYLGTASTPANGGFQYLCEVYGNTTYLLYSAGMDITKTLYNITNYVAGLTNVTIAAKNNITFYGDLPSTVTGLNVSGSAGNVVFDISSNLPVALNYLLGGSQNDTFILANGWQNAPGFYANGGAGNDTIGVPDLNQLYYNSALINNFEAIDIGGHSAISFDMLGSGFNNTNPNMSGYTVSKPLSGAITLANNPANVNTIKFYASPGQTITVPNAVTLNLFFDDSLQSSKGPISIDATLTAAAATKLNLYSYGSTATSYITANSATSFLTTSAATSLNLFGSKTLAVDLANAAAVTTITAANMAGAGVYVTSLAGGTVTTVTGSAYNDTFKFLSGTMASTVVINGGAGTADTINIITSAEMTALKLSSTSNFEIIDFGGSAAATIGNNKEFQNFLAYNPACYSIAINSPITGNLVIAGVPDQISQLSIATTLAHSVSFGYASANLEGELRLVLDNTQSASASGVTLSSFISTNIGVLWVVSGGFAPNVLTSLTLSDLQNMYITGGQQLTITSLGVSTISYNVDASGMNGGGFLSLTSAYSGTAAPVIIGSPNADIFTLQSTNAAIYTLKGLGGADYINKNFASTTGSISYRYENEIDGGSAYGTASVYSLSLSVGGDTITDTGAALGNAFVHGVDKFVIAGSLKTNILNSQTGIFLFSANRNTASTLDFSLDKSGIIFYDSATPSGALATTTLAGVYATITTAIATVANEAVGYRRIIVLEDGNNSGFAVYAFKSITADNKITPNELLLLAVVTAGDAGNVDYTDFLFA